MNDTSSQPSKEISQATYRLDMIRGMFRGIISAGTQTFALFIAIRHFEADDFSKSLIGASPFIGMFFSILMVHYLSNTGWKKSVCGALPAIGCGICLLISATTDSLGSYTLFITLGFIFLHLLFPFLTSIYNDNYPEKERGSFYSKPAVMTVVFGVAFGFIGSKMMDIDMAYYQWILVIMGLAGFGKAWAIFSMPTQPIEKGQHEHPFGNFKLVLEDKSFGYVLLTWFIMGFANLWILPLRVDYVTSSTYGIEGSALFVALIITIIPDSMRAISIPFLARLFDRMNFIALRMILNTLFGSGIALFFLTTDPVYIGLGSALIGIAFGGGSVAWALWVTKYAPPGRVAAYMSVHVCLTGIRGTFGPMIGFWAVKHIGPVNMGWVSFGMMLLATIMLIPEIKHGRR